MTRSPSNRSALLVLAPIVVLLQACSITGLDGSAKYSCKAPDGVQCDSVSGNYANAIHNNLPSQRRAEEAAGSNKPLTSSPSRTAAAVMAPTSRAQAATPSSSSDSHSTTPTPLRSPPLVLRLWVKAWEDADFDLVADSLVYVQVDNGRWLVDHVQRQTREAFAPIRPPKAATAPPPKSSSSADASSGSAPVDNAASVTQALRAFQQRQQANPDH